jgi:Ca-activated chloride channel family protein
MLENFHFIRPLWLLALIPLALLVWQIRESGAGDNPWRRIVDARLLPLLLVGRGQTADRAALWLLAAGWFIAALALADPTWERKPQPVYQTTAARVVVLDLSRSMNATDLKPSRLVRARFKVEDVLDLATEGQTGLVAYAGDAFTVSPMTRDVNTIRALLKVLDPDLMPVDGGRADLGLLKAGELLRQAGASDAQVLLIADGVETDRIAATEAAATRLRSEGYRVSVLGIGTDAGTPLTDAAGALLRDANGKIMSARLDDAMLASVARAGGGEYRPISDDGEALRALLREPQTLHAQAATRTSATAPAWKEQGPLLAVLLLPLAALAFRRNWLLCLVLAAGLAGPPDPAMAATPRQATAPAPSIWETMWNDLWLRRDQQAARAFDTGDYARASDLATDPSVRGSAEYKRGDFRQALDAFSRSTGADADYNRGNALARLGRYQEAIAAYDRSLKENPGSEDARANKAAVEALLKQQQQQQAQQPQNTQDGAAQKDQGRSQAAQDSAHSQPSQQNQASQQSRNDQGQSTSTTPRQQANDQANTGQPDNRPQGGATPAGKGSPRPESMHAGTAQQHPSGNQFAEAARKLDEQRAADRSTAAGEAGSNPAANAGIPAQPQATQRPRAGQAAGAQPLDSEEKMAAEQWLRRIPDDPGGLLRRKFLYQYRQRAQQADDQ